MAFKDIFKSKSTREKEARKKRRKAFRDAESAVESVQERIDKLKSERDSNWTEARGYLKAGQKAAAQRSLQTVRANEMIIDQLEKKRWVFDQLLTKLEMSKTDQEFTQSLKAIDAVVEIDPEAVADVMDEINDKLGEQMDVDKIWNKTFDKEMAGVENQMSDTIPTVEDMMKNLEDEVAADLRGDKIVEGSGEGGSKLAEDISESREKLRKLMEEEK